MLSAVTGANKVKRYQRLYRIDRNLGMKDPINRVIDIPIFGKRYLKYFPIDLVSVDKKLLLIKNEDPPPPPWSPASPTGGENDTEIIC